MPGKVEGKSQYTTIYRKLALLFLNDFRIIAANYLARAKGVTRHMRADEAKKICEDIELITVNSIHGKADLSKYRDAGQKVAEVITRFQGVLERASIDEAYMDISIMVNQRIKAINSVCF